jgi:AcrR family transcriptional regulator
VATEQRRRADAERSIATILDAAVEVLRERPEASMADVASAAGVARQTVYAHYESRAALLSAVAARALDRTLAAIDAAAPEAGEPVEALERLIDAWWRGVEPHARVLEALAPAFVSEQEIHDFHAPILERVERLIRRGRRARAFDRELPVGWMAAAFLGLMHTAAEEVAAGRLGARDAGRSLQRSVTRLFGVDRGARRSTRT